MLKKLGIVGALLILTYSCGNSSNEKNIAALEEDNKLAIAEGLELFESNCISCHNPNASIENRLAPPMFAVKKHYLVEGMTFEEFTKDILAFVKNPSEDKSKMPGALRRFNLMPKMNFSDDQLTKIATYIFFSDIEKPDWFDKHYNDQHGKAQVPAENVEVDFGQKIALQTKSILGKNLMQAINSKGTENALSFCSTRAIPLTDSMSIAANARIKRVSDKNRNPENKANKVELNYLTAMKLAISQGKNPTSQVSVVNNKYVGYYPILTDKLCLQCHGQEQKEILPETLSKIKNLYPKDLARGYKTNELRGIWVVEWDKK